MLGLMKPSPTYDVTSVGVGARKTFYPMKIDSPDLKLSRNKIFQLNPRAQTIDILKMRIEGQQGSTVFQAAGGNP